VYAPSTAVLLPGSIETATKDIPAATMKLLISTNYTTQQRNSNQNNQQYCFAHLLFLRAVTYGLMYTLPHTVRQRSAHDPPASLAPLPEDGVNLGGHALHFVSLRRTVMRSVPPMVDFTMMDPTQPHYI